jgi:CDP-diglyceride synthetase
MVHPKTARTEPSPPAHAQRRPWYRNTAFRRVASGVVFVPLFVLVTRAGGYAFLAFVDLVIVLGMLEFYGMMRAKGMHPYRGIGVGDHARPTSSSERPVCQLRVHVHRTALMGPAHRDNRMYHVSTTIFGVVTSYSCRHFVLLRELPNSSARPTRRVSFVFLVAAVTWASDTGRMRWAR